MDLGIFRELLTMPYKGGKEILGYRLFGAMVWPQNAKRFLIHPKPHKWWQ